MKAGVAGLAVTMMLTASVAFAASPPRPISADRSGSFLIDGPTAEKLWKENTSARVAKLYPSKRFRFVSEVGGGFNDAKLCVVSARAMLLPVRGAVLVYEPVRAATAFDAVPNLSREQCQQMAHDKLKEAIQSVESALVAS